jgi:hypothetical protein
LLKLTPKTVTKPFFKDFSATSNLSTLPIFSEESYSNPALLTLNNYGIYDNESEVDLSDDAYSNSKFINYIYYMNYLSTVNLVTNNVQPFSYIQTLNPFRSNFEESLNNFSLNESNNNLDQASVNDLIDLRSSNFIKLRSTTKNAIVTFNALQKVFRPRFDEGRSNVRAQDLSNTHTPYPFLSEKRVPFEQLLGKNKESFFSPTNYKNYLSSNYSDFSSSLNSLNIYFGNIPFLLSMQSDASRHMWFD